ncbi:hypothetical protein DL95DRAFT_259004, partial [Leptodontidium sp. 2 PMI_412]
EIKSKYLQPIDKDRANADNPEVYQRYYDLFKTLVERYNIDPRNIYNIDEKGFMQGVIAKQRVIVSRDEHFKGKTFATQDGSRE